MSKLVSRNQLVKLAITIGLVFVFALQSGAQSTNTTLKDGHWNPHVKARLEFLIAGSAGQGKVAVFDVDNTMLCRDIGESTFAAMVEDGTLSPDKIPASISPTFMLKDKKVGIKDSKDLTVYYEDFLSATKHHSAEKTPYSNGYAWVVQIMAGMTPADILPYSEKAYADGMALADADSKDLNESKINGYRRPFFYPEMVDLVGVLLKNGYDVYFLSASNVWTVRWMITKQLLPMVQELHGNDLEIAPDHVIGVNVLLKDKRDGHLYKDLMLTKENPAYAQMDMNELANYELTTQLGYPLSGYFGKLANIMKHISLDRPFLIAGDSPNDHPMLNWSGHRLWLTRLEKKGYQQKTAKLMADSLPGEWLVQPVLYKKAPGFVSSAKDLNQRLTNKPKKLKSALDVAGIIEKTGNLQGF